MTIAEAEKKCDELRKQIKAIREKYFMGEGLAKYTKESEIKPLNDEWDELITLIDKTKNETNLKPL